LPEMCFFFDPLHYSWLQQLYQLRIKMGQPVVLTEW